MWRMWRWQPYHLHVPIVLKSWSRILLEHSGPVQACNGIALPFLLVLWQIRTICHHLTPIQLEFETRTLQLVGEFIKTFLFCKCHCSLPTVSPPFSGQLTMEAVFTARWPVVHIDPCHWHRDFFFCGWPLQFSALEKTDGFPICDQ